MTTEGERIAALNVQAAAAKDDISEVRADIKEIRHDVTALQKFQNWISGALATAGFIGGVIAAVATDWLKTRLHL